MLNKTLFEKLAFPKQNIAVTESVQRNIQLIFTSHELLDGDRDRGGVVPSLIDQPASGGQILEEYKMHIEQLIRYFEPRVSSVEVDNLTYNGAGESHCTLKLAINNIQIIEEFYF